MSYLINNQQKVNEIIFANRNKSYGAYAIRSDYGNTVLKSLSIMILGFGTFISVAFYYSNRNNTPEQQSSTPLLADTMVTVFDLKPEEPIHEIEPQKKTEASSSSSSNNMGTTISDTVSVDTHSVLNTDANPTGIATNTPGSGTEGTVTITSTISTTATVNTGPTDLIFVDSGPEFEGGLNALRQFVGRNVKYPAMALEYGKQGTMYVKFVVDEKGKVGSLSLLNNLGYGLDQEALRVVGMIPAFKKPAMVKGQPVKVYYQLPIKFTLSQ